MSLESSWEWKLEPCSPLQGPDSPSAWSVQDYDSEASTSQGGDPSDIPTPSKSYLAQKLLEDLEDYVKEEETFSNWFDDKVTLPIFDDLQSLPVLTTELISNSSTVDLAQLEPAVTTQQQFYPKAETDVSYALGHGHLTPPQSPPASVPQLSAPILSYEPFITLDGGAIYQHGTYILAPPSPDLAQEMAVVDDVVSCAAQKWEHEIEYTDSSSRSSECTEDSDDPDWEAEQPSAANGRRARQSRPYNVKDRRLRKKEQNKTAATRYRQKKKAEANEIVQEVRELEDKNTSLTSDVGKLRQEITYLKGLMREMFRVKGLLK